MGKTVETIFGTYAVECKKRLDLSFDYETCAIRSFKDVANILNSTYIYDIGANVGIYSVYCSDVHSLRGIHAFEPAPAAHELLQKNVNLQTTPTKITVHSTALSDGDGEVNFMIVSPLSGLNSIVTEASDATKVVKSAALDHVSSIRDEIICVKIDVEGHELPVLRGGLEFFTKNYCYVQVESLRHEMKEEIKEILSEYGYVYIFSLQHDHLFIHKSLAGMIPRILAVIADELAKDLQDLTELRVHKRKWAQEAKVLWQNAGYRRDPLLKVE